MSNLNPELAGRNVHPTSDLWRSLVSKWHKTLENVKNSATGGPKPDRSKKDLPLRGSPADYLSHHVRAFPQCLIHQVVM
jgi:hypothetical protein